MRYIPQQKLLSVLALLVLTFTAGCQTQNVNSFFVGQQVSSDDSLPLIAGEERSGQWQTFDILVNYRYRLENSSLNISGDTTLSDYHQMNVRSLRNMDMFLFLLDDQHRVLETVQLFKALSSDLEAVNNFKNTITVPKGATTISFGYRGFTKEGLMTGLKRFDHLPKKETD